MRRPLLKSVSTYYRLQMAIREQIITGGDVPCLRTDSNPNWWFSDDERDIFRAKECCRVCPVIDLCDTHARVQDEHGVWAAQTRIERNQEQIAVTSVLVVVPCA